MNVAENTKTPYKVPVKQTFKYFLGLMVLVTILLTAFLFLFFIQDVSSRTERLKLQEKHFVLEQKIVVGTIFKELVADARLLSKQHEFTEYFATKDFTYLKELEKEMEIICSHRNYYDQVRYLNKQGCELIRANRQGDQIVTVSEDKLQNKANRKYFKNIKEVAEGKVYISPMELNVENGKIEVPFKPVLRIGAGIYAGDDAFEGAVFLNAGSDVIFSLIESVSTLTHGKVMIMNEDGTWLKAMSPSQEWGNSIPERADEKFQNYYDGVWDKMLYNKSGQIITEDGLFTFIRISPYALIESKYRTLKNYCGDWILVSYIEHEQLHKLVSPTFANLIQLGSLFLLVSIIPLWSMAHVLVRKKIARKNLVQEANYDVLTRLPNRKNCFNYISGLVDEFHYSSHPVEFLVLFLDLDGFKNVNDTMGHEAGDELLTAVARRMENTVRNSDMVARIGGDEFMIVLAGQSDYKIGAGVADKIISAVSEPFKVEKGDCNIGVSIGIAAFPHDGESLEDITDSADSAMYKAKKNGKNRWMTKSNDTPTQP